MIHWKWTQGEPYERSRRRNYQTSEQGLSQRESQVKNQSQFEDTQFYDNKVLDDTQLEKHANNAFNVALNHDEYTWEMLNQQGIQIQNEGFRQVNKREDTDKKLSERQMFANVSMNPFLTNSDYVNDITVQNDFLQPQGTNLFKE